MTRTLNLVLIALLTRIILSQGAVVSPTKSKGDSEIRLTGLAELESSTGQEAQSYHRLKQRHKSQEDAGFEGLARSVLTSVGLNFSDGALLLEYCQYGPEGQVQDLDETNCRPLKMFNQTALDELPHDDMVNLVSFCACQVARMFAQWEFSYDNNPDSRRVATMVQQVFDKHTSSNRPLPNYLWSDIEVIQDDISIYTATSDYFFRLKQDKLTQAITEDHSKDEIWLLVTRVCQSISRDTFHVYRYMENIRRASIPVFHNLLLLNQRIAMVYEASKACKLLLIDRFDNYKRKAEDSNDPFLNPSYNSLPVAPISDVDTMLRSDLSALLLDCKETQSDQQDDTDHNPPPTSFNCSILSDSLPPQWIHRLSQTRSQVALKCGCQLLGYNSNWTRILHDPNVEVMSKAMTNYMNRNAVPNFADSPIGAIYEWSELVMSKFRNRKFTQKEVIKALSNDEDPLEPKSRSDLEKSLELIRRACNYIIFNYNKGSKSGSQQNVVMTIKYLDNLQLMSPDPLFVFHLTLQDPDLFKLHSLSKMCKPFVS